MVYNVYEVICMLIGRKDEVKILNRLYDSDQSEFVAVYGRRRVGKTYLVNEVFSDRITFSHTGLSNAALDKNFIKHQLNEFYNSLLRYGMKPCSKPKTWFDAFLLLELFLQEKSDGSRQVVFLDELPWMDTPKSNFMAAFEGFWNSWAYARGNVMLIVSGSSTSWITNKLINNYGGLYNRLTYQMKLSPFNLSNCEELCKSLGINFSRYDIVQNYMILGGIPYYLRYLKPELSLSQNIDNLFFNDKAIFKNEFKSLFSSTFTNPDVMMKIVGLLSKKGIGFSREEIVKELKMTDGGRLSEYLEALVDSDFIRGYIPFGGENKMHYQLIDPFCFFYLKFVAGKQKNLDDFWTSNLENQSVVAWRGFAFERVCFNHIREIKRKLGIESVLSTQSSFQYHYGETGSQIDMIIDRKDGVVSICEMKFLKDDLSVNNELFRSVLSRADAVGKIIPKYKSTRNVLITTFGIKRNSYSDVFVDVVTIDDLFS